MATTGAVDAVAGARRERLAAAADGLPGLYLATLAISGLALVANAAALTASARRDPETLAPTGRHRRS